MLKWISDRIRPKDDSAASEAAIKEFLETLPAAKPALVLYDIGERFTSEAETELNPAVCRRALHLLDQAAQAYLERSWNELFDDSLGKSISDGLWQALANYYRKQYSGYAHVLEQLPAPDNLAAGERPDAQIFSVRAMAALMAHKALMRIRYRDPYSTFWTDVDGLLTRAQRYEMAQIPVKPYPSMPHVTTVEREYLTGLLLDVAPIGNLLPTQTHCLHLILRRLNEHFRLYDHHTTQTPFCIDPATGKQPQRWFEGQTPRPGMRFFGFGAAHKQLGMLRQVANTDAKVPEWLRQSRIDTDRYRALLGTLMEHWSQNPPKRRARRNSHVAKILVSHELTQVYRMLAYSKFAREGRQINYTRNTFNDSVLFDEFRFGTVDENKSLILPDQKLTPMELLHKFELAGDRELTEEWSVVDMSEGGLGVVAEKHRGWLRAGMLLGYRYEESIEWRIAVVRRVGRIQQGKLGAGLECLEKAMNCARLRLHKENEKWVVAGIGADPFVYAIVVGAQAMLIAAPETYAPERECIMKIEKSTQHIRLEQLLEKGLDFERISFSIVEKS